MSIFRLICLAVILLIIYGMSRPKINRLNETKVQKLEEIYLVSYSEDEIIILKDNQTGFEQQYKLSNIPSAPSLFNQIIDLTQIDTADFSGVFTLIDTLLVTGNKGAYPLIIEDIDHDQNLDFLGIYNLELDFELKDCGICELQPDNQFETQIIYKDNLHTAVASCDFDQDGNTELLFRCDHTDTLACLGRRTPNSYPDSLLFLYSTGSGEINHETVVDADSDGELDIIHKGEQNGEIGMCVAEYDPASKRLVKRFYHQSENFRHWGLSHGDYDNDGYLEFVTATIDGEVYIYENTGNDNYSFILEMNLNTLNAYLNCTTNDIDGNGKIEFFIGGLEFYDNYEESKVYWFEAIGDNEYEVKYSLILRGVDGLGLTELYNYDVNADGVDDLVFCYFHTIVILIWNTAGNFDLVYYAQADYSKHDYRAINVYDIYNTGTPNLIVSLLNRKSVVPYECSKVYKNNLVTGLPQNPPEDVPQTFRLHQNYPNPFNPTTTINFTLNRYEFVELKIYNVTGEEVSTLVSRELSQGNHSYQFDASGLASGIYYYQLVTTDHHEVKKMAFIK